MKKLAKILSLLLLAILLTACTGKFSEVIKDGADIVGEEIGDIAGDLIEDVDEVMHPTSPSETETTPESTTTLEPTTTPELTTTPEPTTTPELTTTPEPTTTPAPTTTAEPETTKPLTGKDLTWQDGCVVIDGTVVQFPTTYEKFCEIVKERAVSDELNKEARANMTNGIKCHIKDKEGSCGYFNFYNNSSTDMKAINCPLAGIKDYNFMEHVEFPYGLYADMTITEEELINLVGTKPSRIDDNTSRNAGKTYHWSKAPAEMWAYQSGAWAKNCFSVTISSKGEITEINYTWYTE